MPFVERFTIPGLGHASYLLGDEAAGVAAVVDPARDPAPYLAAAARRGVRIAWVLDTHGHNDYLSGVRALVDHGARAIAPIGASVGYPAELGWHWRRFELGDLELELLHTPGHTPEHTAVLVHGLGPAGLTLLSGGSLLCGDVGRPDLLGDDSQRRAAAHALTRTMLDVVLALPDETVVLPTHIGGSFCAGSIRPGDSTTIGDERTSNPTLLAMQDDPDDIDAWLDPESLPPVPAFWPRSRARNLAGVAPLDPSTTLPQLDAEAARTLSIVEDVVVFDVRSSAEHAAAHLEGSLLLPATGSFPVWAGIAAYGREAVLLVARDADHAKAAAADLVRVHPRGAIGWVDGSSLEPGHSQAVTIARAAEAIADVRDGHRTLIDVRNPLEMLDRPMRGATAIPASTILANPGTAPNEPLAIACASGYRAVVVASALWRAGHPDVVAIDESPFDAVQASAAAALHR